MAVLSVWSSRDAGFRSKFANPLIQTRVVMQGFSSKRLTRDVMDALMTNRK